MDKTTVRHIFFATYENLAKLNQKQPSIDEVEAEVRSGNLFTQEQILEGRKAFEEGIARIQKNAKRHQNLLRNQQKRFLGGE